MADVFRILQNSPWSPAKFSLESNFTQRSTNSQSGIVDDSRVNGRNTAVVPGVTFTRAQSLPPVAVLWWSAKTVRLAEAKRLQARSGAAGASNTAAKDAVAKVEANMLPDYILTVEGDEPLRILRDAREDLRDTVFLELENGGVLDLMAVRYVDGWRHRGCSYRDALCALVERRARYRSGIAKGDLPLLREGEERDAESPERAVVSRRILSSPDESARAPGFVRPLNSPRFVIVSAARYLERHGLSACQDSKNIFSFA